MLEFLIILAAIWLIVASVWDLKTREVPNWLNFSLIIFALGFRALLAVTSKDVWVFLYGLLGFAIFFILAYMFYYARIFAGGDAKLLMGLGAVLVLGSSFYDNLISLGGFILLLLLVGGVYGLVYSGVLAVKNRKEFSKEFSRQLNTRRKLINISRAFASLSLLLVIFMKDIWFFVFPVFFFLLPYMFIYGKSVEETCLVRDVSGEEITVGDWLYDDVRVGERVIRQDWQGLDEKQAELLRKGGKKVRIRYGIPFVPSFLISFILFLVLWYSPWSFLKFLWP